ncbi:hypothetical protein E2P70_21945 [Xanthomonas perforans]|uniref:hypothetical protein n=1 Tax=Xanthomonas perforans TaxID=442694 RepID=UPI001191AB5C|nr:hypothetical protein [Xanthomonas perforans]TVS59994.1 hypothetical protein E2P70_21945 [Xanthomonas perforans]
MTSPMSITTLAALASAGVLRTVQLVGQVGGYTVMVRVGQTEKQLTGQRGEPRVFASLDTAATPAKPAKKRAGAATVATAAKILPSDRAQLKLPGLPRTRKTARTGGSAGIRVKNSQK